MRRRRKFKGTWLPNIGTTVEASLADGVGTSGVEMVLTISALQQNHILGVVPLTFDTPQETAGALVSNDSPMSQFLANGYALRRIVGKIWAHGYTSEVQTATEDDFPGGYTITAGFFIARAQDDNQSIASDLPIGWSASANINYNPDWVDNIREPWIWRRQWLVSNSARRRYLDAGGTSTSDASDAAAYYPPNTGSFGSVLDGPHIDCRTRRRVSSDDRLWFTVAAQPYPRPTSGFYNTQSVIAVHLDYRLFGALRRDRNRGNF